VKTCEKSTCDDIKREEVRMKSEEWGEAEKVGGESRWTMVGEDF